MQATQNDTNKKKRVLIQLRSSYEEKITLKEFARLAGMNITDFIKSRTLQKPPRMKVVTPEREILLRMLSELSKIGSNINQIAKKVNTTGDLYPEEIKELKEMVKELWRILRFSPLK